MWGWVGNLMVSLAVGRVTPTENGLAFLLSMLKDVVHACAVDYLETDVANLGNWNKTAKEVIDKADKKCGEILEKVSQTQPEGKIFENAQSLQTEGKRLLQAATEAKRQVGKKVGEALEAIVRMDRDLKRDLKSVKDKIKGGIESVIDNLEVMKLGENVKSDLGELRRKIEKLEQQVEPPGGLVSGQLEQLKKAKEEFNQKTNPIKDETGKLEQNFRTHIQDPLNLKVLGVDQAIGTLGGKFSLSKGKDNIQGIFDYIKTQVAAIKGSARKKTGLEGIKQKVKDLAEHFVDDRKPNHSFKLRVDGWLEGIIGNNGQGTKEKKGLKAVTSWLGTNGVDALKRSVKDQIMAQIISQMTAAQVKFNGLAGNIEQNSITQNLDGIKQACDEFVSNLDEQITKSGIGPLATRVLSGIQGKTKPNNTDNLEFAVKAALVALCVAVKTVADELQSLGIGKFGNLDEILRQTNELHTALEGATSQSTSAGPHESPAQAVDSKLNAVRNFVNGNNGNDNITKKFEKDVKQPLADAVGRLPAAVRDFNGVAEQQIKAAAITAITKAVEEIEMDVDGKVKLDEHGQMSNFEKAHKLIREKLDGDLKKLVEDHIGEDDTAGGQGGTISELAGGSFEQYSGHVARPVKQSFNGTQDEGQLPYAIGSIKIEVDKALDILKPNGSSGQDQITTKTFEEPFNDIKTELDEIAECVDSEKATPAVKQLDNKDGIRQRLSDLTKMLLHSPSVFLESTLDSGITNPVKGLDAIKSAIDALQQDPFTNRPAASDSAVKAIRQELEQLRGKLKKDNGEDVILTLTELQSKGLEKQDWQNGKGQPLSGLGKIESELQKENAILPEETRKITEAIIEIRRELARVGFKLQGLFTTNDVIDELTWLGNKIGKNGIKAKDNLHDIYEKIRQLQQIPFQEHPTKIQDAKQEIVHGLTALQIELQGKTGEDVIKTLEDLQNNGLSATETWTVKGESKKGLAKIENELQRQQGILHNQPNTIGQGVTQITGELERLRGTLNAEVTDKLSKLKQHGLEKGATKWNEGNNINGLVKIKNQLEKLKNEIDQNMNRKVKSYEKGDS
ncbi:Extracellular matrix-binding ebh, putative [Babesia ovata]|uniref:Extracellular matrix-binding ebh, putative n=1 Tax=Babesia ovata TaxID=189622 RepID=A0A2H6KFK7_9APIC|nr:Extracellular matrix-binding ebh, putative [Babesia ovata]GBE61783.1 Extracellular matrix-binding ebh, putative [Babesia ovata]